MPCKKLRLLSQPSPAVVPNVFETRKLHSKEKETKNTPQQNKKRESSACEWPCTEERVRGREGPARAGKEKERRKKHIRVKQQGKKTASNEQTKEGRQTRAAARMRQLNCPVECCLSVVFLIDLRDTRVSEQLCLLQRSLLNGLDEARYQIGFDLRHDVLHDLAAEGKKNKKEEHQSRKQQRQQEQRMSPGARAQGGAALLSARRVP